MAAAALAAAALAAEALAAAALAAEALAAEVLAAEALAAEVIVPTQLASQHHAELASRCRSRPPPGAPSFYRCNASEAVENDDRQT